MDEVFETALGRWRRGETVGIATVVSTSGSAPRPIGASMLVAPDGTVVGSVSGGCVEGQVYELAQEVMAEGSPVLEHYGYSDSDAFAVGLTCGGELDVFVQRLDRATFPEFEDVATDIAEGRPVAVATVINHPDQRMNGRRIVVRPGYPPGSDGKSPTISPRADGAIYDDAVGALAAGENEVLVYGPVGERLGEGMRVFVQSYAPRARMIVFGAIDFASAVCKLGTFLGYDVTVCDARAVFATAARFPEARDVVVDWPHRYLAAESDAGRTDERTVVVVLTHDSKFDVPVLELALRLPLAYVGAMGSRRTHEERLARLREADVEAEHLRRLHSPIGLDLGARTPEETALSIAAEITACRWGGSGTSLAQTTGAIHHIAESREQTRAPAGKEQGRSAR